jgi:hypothetical protein
MALSALLSGGKCRAADKAHRGKPTSSISRNAARRNNLPMIDGTWLFVERLLYVDWLEERALP